MNDLFSQISSNAEVMEEYKDFLQSKTILVQALLKI